MTSHATLVEEIKEFSVSQYPRGQKMGYTLRTPRYRLVLWMKNGWDSKQPFSETLIDAKELYDYEKDPLETASLHNHPEYRTVLRDLLKQAAAFFAEQEKNR